MSFNYQTAEHTRRKLIENVLQLPWSLQNYILTILRACTLSTPVHEYKGEKLNTQHFVAYDDS